jgi:ribosomal protein S18 acetylase RimI-like enzyme
MHYRELLQSDVPVIARIHRRACLIAYAFMNWSYSESDVRNWYAEKFQDWDWGLIGEQDSTAVGFIAVSGAHLDQLFVDPDYQRRGLGTYLLREALGRAPSVATLNVFEQNTPACEFYERHGFREVRRFLNEREQSVELVYGRDPRISN